VPPGNRESWNYSTAWWPQPPGGSSPQTVTDRNLNQRVNRLIWSAFERGLPVIVLVHIGLIGAAG
jgi:hypothetical protein